MIDLTQEARWFATRFANKYDILRCSNGELEYRLGRTGKANWFPPRDSIFHDILTKLYIDATTAGYDRVTDSPAIAFQNAVWWADDTLAQYIATSPSPETLQLRPRGTESATLHEPRSRFHLLLADTFCSVYAEALFAIPTATALAS